MVAIVNGVRAIISALAHNYHFLNAKCTDGLWTMDVLSILLNISSFTIGQILATFWCFSWQINISIMCAYVCFLIVCLHGVIAQNLEGFYHLRLIVTCLVFILGQFWYWMMNISLHLTKYNANYNNKLYDDGIVYGLIVFAMIGWFAGGVVHSSGWPEKWINNRHKKDETLTLKQNDSCCNCDCNKISNFGTSHQLWHIFINLGNYLAIIQLFFVAQMRSRHDTC